MNRSETDVTIIGGRVIGLLFSAYYLSIEGKWVTVLEKGGSKALLKGIPEPNGGLIEQDMDLTLSVVTSMDDDRKIIFWWTPGKSMIANTFIPCIHADPYFCTIKPAKEAYAEGLILKIKSIVKYLKNKRLTGNLSNNNQSFNNQLTIN